MLRNILLLLLVIMLAMRLDASTHKRYSQADFEKAGEFIKKHRNDKI